MEIKFLQFSHSYWTKISWVLLGEYTVFTSDLFVKTQIPTTLVMITLYSMHIYKWERMLQPTILPQNFERNWNPVFKSFDCAFKRLCKRIFLSFLSTHNRTEKKKGESLKILKLFPLHFTYMWAQNLISKNFIALESENNNKFQDFSVIPYVHVLAIIACYVFQKYLFRYLEEINSGLSDLYL